MKTLTFVLIATLLLVLPTAAFALSLSVTASVSSGTTPGNVVVLKCNGWKFIDPLALTDPWNTANCPTKTPLAFTGSTTFDFGTLTHYLLDTNGNEDPAKNAGCFFSKNFYIVYLYPDAWGGKGYELRQTASFGDVDVQKAVVFTPVYAANDEYDINGDSDTSDPGEDPQGTLDGTETGLNPDINKSKLATTSGALILKAKRPRIVRAEYGLPPQKADGTPWATGWVALPTSKSLTGNPYTGNVQITLTEWQ